MDILVVGLGLIGGSYAMSLSNKGHNVYGVDIDKNTLDFALNKKWIVSGSRDASQFIPSVDMIIIGLYPELILKFLKEYSYLFKENQIITDVCGVKSWSVKCCETAWLQCDSASVTAKLLRYPVATVVVRLGVHESWTEVALRFAVCICRVGREGWSCRLCQSVCRVDSFGVFATA